MKNNRKRRGAALMALLLFLVGCTAAQPVRKENVFRDPSGVLELSCPEGWAEDERLSTFDLGCMDSKNAYYTGVMIYYKRESGGQKAVLENLQFHMMDIADKRGDTAALLAPEQKTLEGRTLTRAAISGENEGQAYAYLFTAVDFGAEEDAFAILIQTASLDDWEQARPVLEGIGDSCTALRPEA